MATSPPPRQADLLSAISSVTHTAGRARRHQQQMITEAAETILAAAVAQILPEVVREAHPRGLAEAVYAKRRLEEVSALNLAVAAFDQGTTSYREWQPLGEAIAEECIGAAVDHALRRVLRTAVQVGAAQTAQEEG